ncbi:response regulator rcp1 [bacterium BMS3Abin07]|nr:response regulator rcp1 [bacterium BMS3Abin07]HDL20772.1 response regulator [Nitrospirota bacterium]HDO21734.1 response regulator [Nitrospirota bacterium]HDZ88542.1 response regulator [Nitrospirota bacterium]
MTTNNDTILLVEDDPNDILLIERAFEKVGTAYPLTVLNNGEEAAAFFERQGQHSDDSSGNIPLLILLDLKMPRMNGFEFLQWRQEQSEVKRIPVVVLTSSTENKDINHAYDLGANSYLVKPVQFEDLTILLRGLHLYWLITNQNPKIC